MGHIERKSVFRVSDTNQAVQSQKMVRGLNFRIKKVEGLYSEKKALIGCTVISALLFSHMQKEGLFISYQCRVSCSDSCIQTF